MAYSINRLSKLTGVSIRALHYYDEIGLISPKRISSNGYRVYEQKEVDLLQQILFYRELGVPLADIKKIMWAKNYDGVAALQSHLSALKNKREQLNLLITNVEKTIAAAKGEITMNDEEKFQGFKQRIIEDNERAFGTEVRAKYGEDDINASHEKIMGLTREQYAEAEELSRQINNSLKEAFEAGNPSGELAQKVCAMHKKWLAYFWKNYAKEAQLGLAQTYVDDPRFTKYYDDNVAAGCTEFFLEAMKIYCQ